MHERRCPICGAQSFSFIYQDRNLEIVGCDICMYVLDEWEVEWDE